jgi:hypothetical protein
MVRPSRNYPDGGNVLVGDDYQGASRGAVTLTESCSPAATSEIGKNSHRFASVIHASRMRTKCSRSSPLSASSARAAMRAAVFQAVSLFITIWAVPCRSARLTLTRSMLQRRRGESMTETLREWNSRMKIATAKQIIATTTVSAKHKWGSLSTAAQRFGRVWSYPFLPPFGWTCCCCCTTGCDSSAALRGINASSCCAKRNHVCAKSSRIILFSPTEAREISRHSCARRR